MQYFTKERADKKNGLKPYSPLMVSAANPRDGSPAAHISSFLRKVSTGVSSFLAIKPPSPTPISRKILNPLLTNSSLSLASPSNSAQSDSLTLDHSNTCCSPDYEPGPEFPSGSQILTAKGGGPAFVGRVYGIYGGAAGTFADASSHIHIPFPFKRSPEWLKKMFAAVTKSVKNRNGPRFFIDWDDAASYLQEHYIPNGVVDSCRLAIAYEYFKENPHSVQFVQNKRQVKEAEKLLKTGACGVGKSKPDGVLVFSSQNLDLVIETGDGIKRYTPYFFDKNLLDGILEDSVDQYFQMLILRRDAKRWGGDAVGNVNHNQNNAVVKRMEQITMDLPEIQEVQDEVSGKMRQPGTIPLSLLPKLAETEILYTIDRMLLGNRWLRKAIGIQPKFPYVVDSFEKKADSFQRANKSPVEILDSEFENAQEKQAQITGFQFPFGDWLTHPWLNNLQKQPSLFDTRVGNYAEQHRRKEEVKQSLLLPKVTIVNILTEDPPWISEADSQKTTRHLLEELDREDQVGPSWTESTVVERDPLFVADFEELSAWFSSPRVS